jgi:hypothetical protein
MSILPEAEAKIIRQFEIGVYIALNRPEKKSVKYLYKNMGDTINYYNEVFSYKYLYDKNRKIEYCLDGEKKTLPRDCITKIPGSFAGFFQVYLMFLYIDRKTGFSFLLCENFQKIIDGDEFFCHDFFILNRRRFIRLVRGSIKK